MISYTDDASLGSKCSGLFVANKQILGKKGNVKRMSQYMWHNRIVGVITIQCKRIFWTRFINRIKCSYRFIPLKNDHTSTFVPSCQQIAVRIKFNTWNDIRCVYKSNRILVAVRNTITTRDMDRKLESPADMFVVTWGSRLHDCYHFFVGNR